MTSIEAILVDQLQTALQESELSFMSIPSTEDYDASVELADGRAIQVSPYALNIAMGPYQVVTPLLDGEFALSDTLHTAADVVAYLTREKA
jgi:hypothetical protein